MNFLAATAALLIERLVGYPPVLYRAVGHPVEWMGEVVTFLDHHLNSPGKSQHEGRIRGVACLALLIVLILLPSLALALLARSLPFGWLWEALLAVPLLAQKSLRDHVSVVAVALGRSLEEARKAVAMIVGRDPATLDESGIARAALESLAENASDGVVAPALWFAVAGLPGIAVYKAINTADSMIGHKSPRYLHFGWAAARLDDFVNLPASRLTAALFILAAAFTGRANAENAAAAVRRDAGNHVSPNAGWSESALAGALGIRLGGPRSYQGREVDLATMGNGRGDLGRSDIEQGLSLYARAMTMLAAGCALLALLFSM